MKLSLRSSADTSGLDNFARNIERAKQKFEAAGAVTLAELMPPAFMARHSRFESFDALLQASPFTIDTQDDFAAIADDAWDAYICGTTQFSTWQAMLKEAGVERFQQVFKELKP